MNSRGYLEHKKISIIIPCYNVADTIDRCINSILTQNFDINALEILIIDDDSEDITWEKIKSYESRYPTIIRVFKITHGLQGRARNLGIEMAKGEYLMFVDADDYLVDDKDALQKIWNEINIYKPDVVRFLFEGDKYNADSASDKLPNKIVPIISNADLNDLFAHYSLRRACWDKLYKRRMVKKCNLHFPERLIDEESGFVIPAYFCMNQILFVNETLYHYTDNPVGTCGRMSSPSDFRTQHRIDNMLIWSALYIDFLKNFLNTNYELVEWLFIMNYYFYTQTLNKMRGIPCERDELEKMSEYVLKCFPNCIEHERFKNIEDSDTYPNASLLRKEK